MKRPVALLALASQLAMFAPTSASAQGAAPPAPAPAPAPPSAAPSAAHSADAPADRAKGLKADGDRAIGEMRYADALTAYDAAYQANPSFEVLFNRGRAYQFLGKYPEALADFESFAREAPGDVRARVPGIDKIVSEVRAKVAYLTIRSSVAGATVVLGDRVLGTTPLSPRLGVNAGTVVVKATANGREPYERALELGGGGQEVQIELVMAAVGDGLLRIDSGTRGAVAFVDGRRLGAVPVEAPVAPGDHQVRLEADDYEAGTQQANVGAGATRTVRFDLVPEPEVYETWWFWTGVGLVVAGGVATAIIVTREKDPPEGDFSPGQVNVANRPVFSF